MSIMIPVLMPQVGQDIPTGTVAQWLKKEGEPVRKGEVIVIVESEKAAFEVEAEQDGVLLKILHPAESQVPVLEPIAYIGQPGEESEAQAVPAWAGEISKTPAEEGTNNRLKSELQAPAEAHAANDRIKSEPRKDKEILASPAARRLAREKGIDLATVRPTGPGGRIVERDVLAAAEARGAAASDTVIPFGRLRKELARRLTLSKQTIPHFYLFAEVDMTAAHAVRQALNQQQGCRVTVTDLVIYAAAKALREFDRMNVHVESDRMIVRREVNIGVAVAVEDGLLVPVIPRADQKGLAEIAEWSRKNAEAARRGLLEPTAPGTFTITSLGMHGVRMFLPVINPPECAILAVGAVEPRPVVIGEAVAVRPMMTLTLACDHRAVDGVYAGRFLNRIKELLEKMDKSDRSDKSEKSD
ncbi:MAG: 2-oxo acid dehydrogenase subunit E2 [Candidatus Sumerlaeia bacterium]|nr:2-oxo acid dehydrogenase subunit E2 [Candidatus Sumerlaeia bacterium]